jgi:universal stress protein E
MRGIRSRPPQARPRIVAAVHASTEDPGEHALDQRLASLAFRLGRLENGSTTLLQAWEPFGERLVRRHFSAEKFADYVDAARRSAEEDLDRLVRSLPEAPADVEFALRRGEPEAVIPAFVAEQGVDLVVIGTIARTGIAGFFIGNTAERVLGKLTCSVLAVKPDGFVSPVSVGP